MPKYKPVYVEWDDSHVTSSWQNSEERDYPLCPIETLGWLIKKDRRSISVAQSWDTDNHGYTCDVITIPRGCIRKIQEINIKKEAK